MNIDKIINKIDNTFLFKNKENILIIEDKEQIKIVQTEYNKYDFVVSEFYIPNINNLIIYNNDNFFNIKNKNINAILACGLNGEIGINNRLLAKLPIDMNRFVELTNNSTVIMGSSTAKSLKKPLKNRENIILSKNNFTIDGFKTYNNIFEAIANSKNDNIWIIGGAQIYNMILDLKLFNEIHLTLINNNFENADSFVNIKNLLQLNEINNSLYNDNSYECYYKIYKNV